MEWSKFSIYGTICLCIALTVCACQKEETGIIVYKAEAKTETGARLVENTDLIATVFEDSSYEVTEGVQATEMFYFSMKGYAMHMFIFEVDLANPAVTLKVGTPNGNDLPAMQTVREQINYFDTPESTVWGAVNGSFFNTSVGTPHGLMYRNGSFVRLYTSAYPNFFALTKDKKGVVADDTAYEELKDNIEEALGGGVMLTRRGSLVSQTEEVASINPRTCVGVSEDGKTVWLMVVDGRNYHYSNGMTYEELGKCMIALGASNALNLDGGGSSTFLVRNSSASDVDEPFDLRNWPADNGGQERAIGNSLLILSNN